jgi:hypothetical protein
MADAIAWHSQANFVFAGSSMTVVFDAAAATGDLVRLHVQFYASQAFDPTCAGWTQEFVSGRTSVYEFWHVLSSADVTAGQAVFAIDNGFVGQYIAVGFTGVDATNPTQDGLSTAEANGDPVTFNVLTLTGSADYYIAFGAVEENSGNIVTDPVGLTLLAKQVSVLAAATSRPITPRGQAR